MQIGLSDPMAAATTAWLSTLAPKIWEVECTPCHRRRIPP